MAPENLKLSEILLNRHESKIDIEYILNGGLAKLIDSGLLVVTLCNDGSGRSLIVATRLNQNHIPAVAVSSGLVKISDSYSTDALTHIFWELNRVNILAVILTKEEVSNYYTLLSQLKAMIFKNSESAVASICRIHLNSLTQSFM